MYLLYVFLFNEPTATPTSVSTLNTALELWIVPLVAVILSGLTSILILFLTFGRENKESKIKMLRERLDNFYIPFYLLCSKDLIYDFYPLFNSTDGSQNQIVGLLISNIHYMDTRTQYLVISLNNAYASLQIAKQTDPEQTNIYTASIKDLFEEIVERTAYAHHAICKKLNLPIPVSEVYQLRTHAYKIKFD